MSCCDAALFCLSLQNSDSWNSWNSVIFPDIPPDNCELLSSGPCTLITSAGNENTGYQALHVLWHWYCRWYCATFYISQSYICILLFYIVHITVLHCVTVLYCVYHCIILCILQYYIVHIIVLYCAYHCITCCVLMYYIMHITVLHCVYYFITLGISMYCTVYITVCITDCIDIKHIVYIRIIRVYIAHIKENIVNIKALHCRYHRCKFYISKW